MKEKEEIFPLARFETFSNFCVGKKRIGWSPSPEECVRRWEEQNKEQQADIELKGAISDMLTSEDGKGIKPITMVGLVFGSLVLIGGIGYVLIRAKKKK